MLKWIFRTMYICQSFMLCVFVLRQFISGIIVVFCLLIATNQFRSYMRVKERELLRLPLEVAIYLDKVADSGKASQSVFLAHLEASTSKVTSDFTQPSLLAPRDLQPERPGDIEKIGFWSTDSLHGGLCHFALFVPNCLYRCCIRPILGKMENLQGRRATAAAQGTELRDSGDAPPPDWLERHKSGLTKDEEQPPQVPAGDLTGAGVGV